jgi:predicted MFS family arabinose efflux permease
MAGMGRARHAIRWRHPESKIARARFAVCSAFATSGLVCGFWSVSLPDLDRRLHLGPTRLGLALLMLAVGVVIVTPLVGRAADRWSSRSLARVAAPAVAVALIGPELAPSFAALAGASLAFGAALGVLDVVMNAQAIEVERQYRRPVMSSFHATWSLGGVLGSVLIVIALRCHLGIRVSVVAGALIVAGLGALPGRHLLARDAPDEDAAQSGDAGRVSAARRRAVIRYRIVIPLAIVALAGYVSETTGDDWSALYTTQIMHIRAAGASLAYATFAAATTLTRLRGDAIRRRLGPALMLGAAGVTAVAGYLLVILAPVLPEARAASEYTGWALAGAGLATVVPNIFSAIGSDKSAIGRELAWITAFAYTGQLGGPALIGLVAGASSLATAMVVPAALAAVVAAVGPIAVIRSAALSADAPPDHVRKPPGAHRRREIAEA